MGSRKGARVGQINPIVATVNREVDLGAGDPANNKSFRLVRKGNTVQIEAGASGIG